MKKTYQCPSIEVLGNISEETKSGNSTNSDVLPFQGNTAFGPDS